MNKKFEQTLPKKMANKHIKWSILLVIMEIQIKTTVKIAPHTYYNSSTCDYSTISNTDKDVEELEFS